jgi:predicted DNA-binding transcriptional regulator AlpA
MATPAIAETRDRLEADQAESGHVAPGRPLTDVEAAARLGVSRFTLRAWRLKGMGPRFLKMGRAVRYRPEDVEEFQRRTLVETHLSGPSADSTPQ